MTDQDTAVWLERGREIAGDRSKNQWDLADWLISGEDLYPEDEYGPKGRRSALYDAAGALFPDHTRETLRAYAAVSRAFPAYTRVYANLKFGHYRAVLALPSDDRSELLKKADDENQSVTDLRQTAQHRRVHSKNDVPPSSLIFLNKHNLAIARFAKRHESGSSTKFQLPGIEVGPHGTVATDGRVLAHMTLPAAAPDEFPAVDGFDPADAELKPFVLPTVAAQKIAKAISEESGYWRNRHACVGVPSDHNSNILVVDPNVGTQIFRPTTQYNGQFPPWEKVMPNPSETPDYEVAFDARLLRNVFEASNDFSADKPVVLAFYKDRVAFKHSGTTTQRTAADMLVVKSKNIGTGQRMDVAVMACEPDSVKDLFHDKPAVIETTEQAAEPAEEKSTEPVPVA